MNRTRSRDGAVIDPPYRRRMEAIPSELVSAARGARDRLAGTARSAATEASGGASQATLARAARQAIFADAVLGALHARLEELKGAAK